MTDLTRAQLDELLGAWALDALDDDERRAVEAALDRDPDLAATARTLREGVGRLTLDADGDGAAAIVGAATAARAPGRDAGLLAGAVATTAEAYADQVAALSALLDRVPGDAWGRPVAAYPGWSVRDLVAHVAASEAYSASVLGRGGFDPGGLEHDHLAMTEATIERSRPLPVAEVVDAWRTVAEATAAHVLALDAVALDEPMPLHGIPFRITTAVVARAFELWTHADDIRAAIGEPLEAPSPGVVHRMAHESVQSLPAAVFTLDELPPPAVAHVVLTGPGGGTWTVFVGGAEGGATGEPDLTLVADVVDYCRVVSRRQDIATLAMHTEGDRPLAVQLLKASQFVAM